MDHWYIDRRSDSDRVREGDILPSMRASRYVLSKRMREDSDRKNRRVL
jgi:hypothetical protein